MPLEPRAGDIYGVLTDGDTLAPNQVALVVIKDGRWVGVKVDGGLDALERIQAKLLRQMRAAFARAEAS